jgi:hypothetical protein
MRTRIRCARVALAIAGVVLFSSGAARADESAPAVTAAPVNAAEVAEARAQIGATIAQMQAVASRVRDDLRAMRKRGTKRQITCADEALSRSDVAVRRARETGADMLAAYAQNDGETARALRVRLGEIREGQRLAAAEGAACGPQVVVAATPGVTTVKLQIDPKIAPAP